MACHKSCNMSVLKSFIQWEKLAALLSVKELQGEKPMLHMPKYYSAFICVKLALVLQNTMQDRSCAKHFSSNDRMIILTHCLNSTSSCMSHCLKQLPTDTAVFYNHDK